jgi:hypothetical protein
MLRAARFSRLEPERDPPANMMVGVHIRFRGRGLGFVSELKLWPVLPKDCDIREGGPGHPRAGLHPHGRIGVRLLLGREEVCRVFARSHREIRLEPALGKFRARQQRLPKGNGGGVKAYVFQDVNFTRFGDGATETLRDASLGLGPSRDRKSRQGYHDPKSSEQGPYPHPSPCGCVHRCPPPVVCIDFQRHIV